MSTISSRVSVPNLRRLSSRKVHTFNVFLLSTKTIFSLSARETEMVSAPAGQRNSPSPCLKQQPCVCVVSGTTHLKKKEKTALYLVLAACLKLETRERLSDRLFLFWKSQQNVNFPEVLFFFKVLLFR